MKVTVFIAASLDGYIARRNGDVSWLQTPESAADESDYGYNAFIETVDRLVMGRLSFEKVLSFGEWPYSVPVTVLSRSGATIPTELSDSVESSELKPFDLLAALEARGDRHVYLDGGQTIQRFLRAGLVDEVILTRVPVLLGDGIPLFGPLDRDIKLELLGSQGYPSGLLQSRYRVLHGRGH